MLAHWDDGTHYIIPDLTAGAFREATKPRRGVTQDVLWQAEHVTTHNTLRIMQRTDRQLLLYLYDQSRGMLGVRCDLFGDLPLPQPASVANDHPTIVKALAFLEPIAMAYSRGEIEDNAGLKLAREQKNPRAKNT